MYSPFSEFESDVNKVCEKKIITLFHIFILCLINAHILFANRICFSFISTLARGAEYYKTMLYNNTYNKNNYINVFCYKK